VPSRTAALARHDDDAWAALRELAEDAAAR
jgi:hypothetical protein